VTTPAAPDSPLVVLRLSDSFNEFWGLLARELGVRLVVADAADDTLPPNALAVVVAAGGAEAEVGALLERLGPMGQTPLVIAGASTSHRVAAQAVAAGAADYYALPEDRDALRSTLAAALERQRAARDRVALATLEAQAHAFREIGGGAIAWQRGAVEEAETYFQRALELARALGDVAAQARTFNNLGILRNLLGLPDEALANYQLALAAYQQDGDVRGMAETHTNMEISWLALGNPGRARNAADEAVRLAREVGDPTLIGLTLVARAEASLALGDPALAAAELRRAEQSYESVRFAAGIPELRRLQAAVARARSDPESARRLLEQAREQAPGRASLDTQAEIERDLGDALAALGDGAGARAARERALALFRRLGARHAEQALTALL
jgi:tetratricopeptide (TPR) repeat protein